MHADPAGAVPRLPATARCVGSDDGRARVGLLAHPLAGLYPPSHSRHPHARRVDAHRPDHHRDPRELGRRLLPAAVARDDARRRRVPFLSRARPPARGSPRRRLLSAVDRDAREHSCAPVLPSDLAALGVRASRECRHHGLVAVLTIPQHLRPAPRRRVGERHDRRDHGLRAVVQAEHETPRHRRAPAPVAPDRGPRIRVMTPRTLRTADGLDLVAQCRLAPGTPRAAVVVVHGFSASAACPNVEALADALHADDLDVITYDARGHGDSPGESTLGDHEQHDVEAAVGLARERTSRVVVVGASMGAIAALRYAVTDGELAGVVTLSCPAGWSLPRNLRGVLAAAMTRTRMGRLATR